MPAVNLTTTVEGKALDATMGKILDDKISENTSSIGIVNNNLGGVIITTEGSGAGIKYFAQLGADSVSKKLLGNTFKVYTVSYIGWGSNNYGTAHQVNISGMISNYKELAVANFVACGLKSVENTKGAYTTSGEIKITDYDSSSGILHIVWPNWQNPTFILVTDK